MSDEKEPREMSEFPEKKCAIDPEVRRCLVSDRTGRGLDIKIKTTYWNEPAEPPTIEIRIYNKDERHARLIRRLESLVKRFEGDSGPQCGAEDALIIVRHELSLSEK